MEFGVLGLVSLKLKRVREFRAGSCEMGSEGLRKWATRRVGFPPQGGTISTSLTSIRVSSSEDTSIVESFGGDHKDGGLYTP